MMQLRTIVSVLGVAQIIAWGSSYYLLAVLSQPIGNDTGWSQTWVVGGLSLGLVVAGLASPRVGAKIQRLGGRFVLASSSVFLSAGLSGLALSHNLPMYLGAWLLIGIGMGAGLYDAAFATLGRLYGQQARGAIAALTLLGGFASTICWPLSAMLVSQFGWRDTCLIYAAVHILVLLPMYLLALPEDSGSKANSGISPVKLDYSIADPAPKQSKWLFSLVATVITISSVISALLSVHLLTILQARDLTLGAAVALAALVGPSQVGARAFEIVIIRNRHPVWTKLIASSCIAIGIGMLLIGFPIISASLIFYGAGIGIDTIARGTLPLAVFGGQNYPTILGRIAMFSLIAQAAAPTIGALFIKTVSISGTLYLLFGVALLNLLLVLVLIKIIYAGKSLHMDGSF